MSKNCNLNIVESTLSESQDGGKFKKKRGRRGPLKTKLEINEFYCLTCRQKRKIRTAKKIQIDIAKNGRKMAKTECNAKDCTRKLIKIVNNDTADKIKDLGKKKIQNKNIPKERRPSLK